MNKTAARNRRTLLTVKKKLNEIYADQRDVRVLTNGTPPVEDARIRGEFVMGARIGSATNIRLFGNIKEWRANRRYQASLAFQPSYNPTAELHYMAGQYSYNINPEVGDDTPSSFRNTIVQGTDPNTTFKGGSSVPLMQTIQLELTNRVSTVDPQWIKDHHGAPPSMDTAWGPLIFPSATPVPVGVPLDYYQTIKYRVIIYEEPELTMTTMRTPPRPASVWYNEGFDLPSWTARGSSSDRSFCTDMHGQSVSMQGFSILPNRRRFDDRGRMTLYHERATAVQPSIGITGQNMWDAHAALIANPVALGSDEQRSDLFNYLDIWTGDAFNPATAVCKYPTHVDTIIDCTSRKHWQEETWTSTTDIDVDTETTTYSRRTRQNPKHTFFRKSLIKGNRTPYRTFQQYVERFSRGDDLDGIKRTAMGFVTDSGDHPNMERYYTNCITGEPWFIYRNTDSKDFCCDNGVTGTVSSTKTDSGTILDSGSNGPFVGTMDQEANAAGTSDITYNIADCSFNLPLNHRYNLVVIPYVTDPKGNNVPLTNATVGTYANIAVTHKIVWSNPNDE